MGMGFAHIPRSICRRQKRQMGCVAHPHKNGSPQLVWLDGVSLLGLAGGGGQQMPVFTAIGAWCTVMDYSTRQLDREREVAAREDYCIDIVRDDMTKPFPFEDGSFDIIFHLVSNCYV